MTTERIPTGSSSASDSDHNRSLDGFRIDDDGFRINEADYLALENIVMDWGRYQRDEWWSKAKGMIEVDEDGCVRKLECPGKTESLHPSIGRLQALEELELGGPIPRKLTSLPEEIGNLGSLIKLNLYRSAIRSLPPSIGRLRSLKELYLGSTRKLTSLPEEIGDLGSLIKVNLNGSAVTSLPPSIGRLRSLKELDIGDTRNLTNLPEEIGNLGSLIKFSLNESAIRSLPPSIGRLRSLKVLYLNRTKQLYGLPEEIGNLGSLINLVLCDSAIRSLPYSINYALSCKVPIGTHLFSAKVLPVILENATRAFRSKIRCNTTIQNRLKPHDAIYHVLLDYNDWFVGILANRNKQRKRFRKV